MDLAWDENNWFGISSWNYWMYFTGGTGQGDFHGYGVIFRLPTLEEIIALGNEGIYDGAWGPFHDPFPEITDPYYLTSTPTGSGGHYVFEFGSSEHSITALAHDDLWAGTWVVSDNFPWQPPGNASPVPEPAAILLLASGLSGLAAFRGKFRKS